MTSMPASRSARAMIFAPRSCPSRPGLAITTRIFRATGRQYMAKNLNEIGARLAKPEHPLPPRALGRPRAVGLGEHVSEPGKACGEAGALGLRGRPQLPREPR